MPRSHASQDEPVKASEGAARKERTPSAADLRRAAKSLRQIADASVNLPDDSLVDARLRERMDLAADVLDAAAGRRRK